MEAMLEAGVGRFRGPSLAAMLAEMWAPLAVALAALATLPSLLGRLQVLILRLRSRGKEAISTYYSSGDDDSDAESDESDSDDAAGAASSGDDEEEVEDEPEGRIGYFEGAADGLDGCFPFGGAVVRTWQEIPRRFSFAGAGAGGGAAIPSAVGVTAVRLWGASTASAEGTGPAWWDGAGDSGRRPAPVVVGWRRREQAAASPPRSAVPAVKKN